MGTLLWAAVVLLYTIAAYRSASTGDVAGTILFCFLTGVGLWRIQKIKDGDNDG